MPYESPYEDELLLSRIEAGSEKAFELLFDKYKNLIYKVAYMYVKSTEIAEEIVQDVFLIVWKHKDTLTGIHSFKAWLYTICRNCIKTRYKKIIAEQQAYRQFCIFLHKIDTADNTAFKMQASQYNELLQQAIASLPKQQREVFCMVKEEGYSYKEAAERLKISHLTVKTHLSRSIQFLRNFLKRNGAVIVLTFFSYFF